MLKVFKWLWRKAEDHGREQVLAELQAIGDYHRMKSEIVALKSKYEPTSKEFIAKSMFPVRQLTPDQHAAVSEEINKITRRHYEVKNARR